MAISKASKKATENRRKSSRPMKKRKWKSSSAMNSRSAAEVPPLEAAADMPPFKIVCLNSPPSKNNRKRKRISSSYSEPEFEPHTIAEPLGIYWTIKPALEWQSLRRYQKFIVADIPLEIGAVVYVNNSEQEDSDGNGLTFDTSKQWVAQVLEVRAKDEHHVYLRVFWLYRHIDLPPDLQATAPYHGEHELIVSNDMEIIDAMTVNGRVGHLKFFKDDKDETEPEEEWYQDLIWRQTFDIRTRTLSKLRRYCICKQPTNPDKLLVRCSNEGCGKWCHAKCIEDATVERETARSIQEASADTDAEKKSDTNGEVVPNKGSSVLSALKNAMRSTPKPTTTKDEAANSLEHEEAPTFEATVFKKHKDEQKQSRCMVKITKRSADGLDEQDWEEDIECLFCGNKID